MAFTTIDSSRYEVGKPVKKNLIEDLATNTTDLDTRTSALESGGSSSVSVFNQVVNLEQSRVGDIRFSLLTDSQFSDRFGAKWVRLDGSSMSGEDLAALYGASLPNFSERFPRISGGSRAVGNTETSQNKSHNHTVQYDNENSGGPFTTNRAESHLGVASHTSQNTNTDNWTNWDGGGYRMLTEGGTEARPDSGVMNAFIKVSETNYDYAAIYTATAGFNITQLKVSNLISGDSGTLTVDLLKGSSLGSLTTMLSSDLTLASTSDYATSSNASFASTDVAQNEFVVLKVKGLQVGQDSFFVNSFGSLS